MIKLVIAITFHYNPKRLKYLTELTQAHATINYNQHTYVITNTKNEAELKAIKNAISSLSYDIIIPDIIGHPYLLTWIHREVFRDLYLSDPSITHFLYTEDDILFDDSNFQYWLQSRSILSQLNLLPGFTRYEINKNGDKVYTDITRKVNYSNAKIHSIGNKTYIQLAEPYHGFYLLDKELAAEFFNSPAWSPDIGIWGIRERAAQGLAYWNRPNMPYSRYAIEIVNYSLIKASLVHHLPNNYALDSTSIHGKIPLGHLFSFKPRILFIIPYFFDRLSRIFKSLFRPSA